MKKYSLVNMKKYSLKLLKFVFLVSIFFSCTKKEILPQKTILGLSGDSWPTGPIDDYVFQNFTRPYNIQVKYKWDPYEVNFTKTLTPVKESQVLTVMDVVNKVWIEPYEKITEKIGFIRQYAPKQFVLVGSAEYNGNGTIKLGEVEGGRKILLLKLNDFDKKNISGITQMAHTIHHEFAHVLHQNLTYPETFKTLNPEWYSATWFNVSNEEANKQGLITNYAKANVDDDFVETVAYLLIEGQEEFDLTIAYLEADTTTTRAQSLKAASILKQKEELVVWYYKMAFNIDFRALQKEVKAAIENL